MEPYDALHAFRRSFYDDCLHRRARRPLRTHRPILTAAADAVPSPLHLSLQASHPVVAGVASTPPPGSRTDRCPGPAGLLARPSSPLAGGDPPVYAVDDVSVWPPLRGGVQPRARGFYYHPWRHSAGQPIVAGWAYQFIARLSFVRERALDRPCGCVAPPSGSGDQHGRRRAGQSLAQPVSGGGRRPLVVRLRRRLRSRVKLQQGLEGSACQIPSSA